MFKIMFLPFKLARTFVRLAGVKGALLLAIGVAIGLLVAPQTGAELRARLQAKLAARGGTDGVPADIDLSL